MGKKAKKLANTALLRQESNEATRTQKNGNMGGLGTTRGHFHFKKKDISLCFSTNWSDYWSRKFRHSENRPLEQAKKRNNRSKRKRTIAMRLSVEEIH